MCGFIRFSLLLMLKKQTNRRIVGDVRLHGFNVMSLSPNDSGVHGVNGAHVYKLLLLKKIS